MLSKLWPARTQNTDGPITDLDAIVAEPVYFRFKAKNHKLEPVSLEDFLKFTNAHDSLMRAIKDPETRLTPHELAEKMHNIFHSVCKTITLQDVLSMEQVQVAAIYQLIIDMVTGQVDMGEGKKKRTKLPIYDIARASSSQNV
jgi:hypothetical protein